MNTVDLLLCCHLTPAALIISEIGNTLAHYCEQKHLLVFTISLSGISSKGHFKY